MRKLTTLLLLAFMVLGCVGTAWGRTSEQIQNDVHYFYDQIDLIEDAGTYSNSEVYSLFVDFTNISTTGNVGMTVYEAVYSAPTLSKNFTTTTPYQWNFAQQQLVKYSLGNVANYYRAEPYNTDITCKTHLAGGVQRDIIPFYVYGQYKSQAIAELYNGIPNCFTINFSRSSDDSDSSSYSGSSSVPSSPISMPVAESLKSTDKGKSVAEVVKAVFSINNNSFVFNNQIEKMDVAPYVKDSRTYVPVRYLAYSLGVKPENITWNEIDKSVAISLDKTTVEMTIGSNIMLVNNIPTKMDVTPEIVDNRTMLPARWLGEALGAKVTWDEQNNAAIIETTN